MFINAKGDGRGPGVGGYCLLAALLGALCITLVYLYEQNADALTNSEPTTLPEPTSRVDSTVSNAVALPTPIEKTKSDRFKWIALSDEIKGLPDLIGIGNMYSLRQAMARDETLTKLVAEFTSSDFNGIEKRFDAVLNRWAGAETVITGSRGAFVNAKHIAILEQLNGVKFAGIDGANPNNSAGPILEASYTAISAKFFAELVAQAQLKDYWDAAAVTVDATYKVTIDFSPVNAVFAKKYKADPVAGALGLAYFIQAVHTLKFAKQPTFAALSAQASSVDPLIAALFAAGPKSVRLLAR